MPVDQLIELLFQQHWLITTLVFPWATFLYAYVTDQGIWALFSIITIVVSYIITGIDFNQL